MREMKQLRFNAPFSENSVIPEIAVKSLIKNGEKDPSTYNKFVSYISNCIVDRPTNDLSKVENVLVSGVDYNVIPLEFLEDNGYLNYADSMMSQLVKSFIRVDDRESTPPYLRPIRLDFKTGIVEADVLVYESAERNWGKRRNHAIFVTPIHTRKNSPTTIEYLLASPNNSFLAKEIVYIGSNWKHHTDDRSPIENHELSLDDIVLAICQYSLVAYTPENAYAFSFDSLDKVPFRANKILVDTVKVILDTHPEIKSKLEDCIKHTNLKIEEFDLMNADTLVIYPRHNKDDGDPLYQEWGLANKGLGYQRSILKSQGVDKIERILNAATSSNRDSSIEAKLYLTKLGLDSSDYNIPDRAFDKVVYSELLRIVPFNGIKTITIGDRVEHFVHETDHMLDQPLGGIDLLHPDICTYTSKIYNKPVGYDDGTRKDPIEEELSQINYIDLGYSALDLKGLAKKLEVESTLTSEVNERLKSKIHSVVVINNTILVGYSEYRVTYNIKNLVEAINYTNNRHIKTIDSLSTSEMKALYELTETKINIDDNGYIHGCSEDVFVDQGSFLKGIMPVDNSSISSCCINVTGSLTVRSSGDISDKYNYVILKIKASEFNDNLEKLDWFIANITYTIGLTIIFDMAGANEEVVRRILSYSLFKVTRHKIYSILHHGKQTYNVSYGDVLGNVEFYLQKFLRLLVFNEEDEFDIEEEMFEDIIKGVSIHSLENELEQEEKDLIKPLNIPDKVFGIDVTYNRYAKLDLIDTTGTLFVNFDLCDIPDKIGFLMDLETNGVAKIQKGSHKEIISHILYRLAEAMLPDTCTEYFEGAEKRLGFDNAI